MKPNPPNPSNPEQAAPPSSTRPPLAPSPLLSSVGAASVLTQDGHLQLERDPVLAPPLAPLIAPLGGARLASVDEARFLVEMLRSEAPGWLMWYAGSGNPQFIVPRRNNADFFAPVPLDQFDQFEQVPQGIRSAAGTEDRHDPEHTTDAVTDDLADPEASHPPSPDKQGENENPDER